MRVAGQRRGIFVPGEVLYSHGTVAHYKQDMVSMYDTVYSTLQCILYSVFGDVLGKFHTF